MTAALLIALQLGLATSEAETAPAPVAPAGQAPGNGQRRLIVVAPDAFHPSLESFVNHKRELLPTELVSLERVLQENGDAASPAADDPERLKRYLYDQWRTPDAGDAPLGYVLLVGDGDVMPVRYMVLDRVTPAAFDYAFYGADLYYADLAKSDGSFDDWNASRDGFHGRYFGEVRGEKNKDGPINFDGVDYLPDVAVGRWPVSTPDEVRVVAEKSIAYERAVLRGDAPGMRRAAMFAVAGWVDTRGAMDEWAAKLAPPGWTVERRYYANRRRDDGTPPPDEGQALSVLNEGVGLLLHAGHGIPARWERSLTSDGLAKLKNADRLPVVVSAACYTAAFTTDAPYEAYVDADGVEHRGTNAGERFDAPPPPPSPYQRGRFNGTSIGEQFVRGGPGGAVAYIGCNTGSQPCGLTLVRGFVESLAAQPEPRLGDCWSGAVRYYHDRERLAHLRPTDDWYPPSVFFQAMKFMVFGDPSLRLPGAVRGEPDAPRRDARGARREGATRGTCRVFVHVLERSGLR